MRAAARRRWSAATLAAWVGDHRRQRRTGPAALRTQRFDDSRLGGTFVVTMTPLINQDGEPAGRVLVARDITRADPARGRAGGAPRAARPVGEAGVARPVRRRHRARDEQPAPGRARTSRAADRTTHELAKPLRKDLRRIYQEADRAAKIVRNLLVFTGSQRMTRRRLRLNRILSRALASRGDRARHGRGIEVARDAVAGSAVGRRRPAAAAAGVPEHPDQRRARDPQRGRAADGSKCATG